MWSKESTHPLLVGMQTYTTTFEISMAVSQKNWVFTYLRIQEYYSGIYTKDAHSHYKDICSTMFIAALFVIVKTWKQPRCLSTKRMDKENVAHLHIRVLSTTQR